jgi:hypothetical protein
LLLFDAPFPRFANKSSRLASRRFGLRRLYFILTEYRRGGGSWSGSGHLDAYALILPFKKSASSNLRALGAARDVGKSVPENCRKQDTQMIDSTRSAAGG